MSLVHEIKQRLQVLEPLVCECEDQSHHHVGHAGNNGGGHYDVLVVSQLFEGVNRIERQRMINAPLRDLFPAQIHALSIRAYSLQQWQQLQQKDSE